MLPVLSDGTTRVNGTLAEMSMTLMLERIIMWSRRLFLLFTSSAWLCWPLALILPRGTLGPGSHFYSEAGTHLQCSEKRGKGCRNESNGRHWGVQKCTSNHSRPGSRSWWVWLATPATTTPASYRLHTSGCPPTPDVPMDIELILVPLPFKFGDYRHPPHPVY